MPQTVEVRFKGIRRGFFTWDDEQDPLRVREPVMVEAERGHDFGRVHSVGDLATRKCTGCATCPTAPPPPTGVPVPASPQDEAVPLEPTLEPSAGDDPPVESPPGSPPRVEPASPTTPAVTRRVLRRASQDEISAANTLRREEEETRSRVLERVRHHQLEMKVSDTEWQWDRSKLTVYFTAEKRVDFRNLVRELAAQFKTRIELRQIGVRDEAARLTGVGRCGREYCCSTWLKELSPVSLALAKDQHLSLNPSQISGGCGRLLCCLRYEHEFYVAARKRFPREGKTIQTARGAEKVVAVDIFRERVFLRNEEGPRIIPLVQLREEMAAPAASPAPSAPLPPRQPEPGRERRPRPERGAPAGERLPRAAPESQPPSETPAESVTSGASPPPPGERRRRRRRRGRRRRPGGQDGSSSDQSNS